MITYQREPLLSVWQDARPLHEIHHKEVSHAPDHQILPDYDGYSGMEDAGMLRIYTARDQGELLGYAVFVVKLSQHFNVFEACQDLLFIKPERRGFGHAFIRWCDIQLSTDGVEQVFHQVTHRFDFSPLLRRLGYEEIGRTYVKRLDRQS